MKKKKVGRPTVRTASRARLICSAVARGLPYVHACAVAGLSRQTFSDWRNQDEKFRDQIAAAIAKGIARRLKKIEDASAAGDWRASAWLLEHCPGAAEHFSRTRLEVTGANGLPLAGAIAVYLPQKTGDVNGSPLIPVSARKDIGNGHD